MSLQFHRYLAKRRAHMPTEQAAAEAGILLGEARLHDAAERAGEYAHIDTNQMPPTDSHQPTEPAVETIDQRCGSGVNGSGEGQVTSLPMVDPGSHKPKEEDMARPRRKAADQVVEVMKPDFDLARRIYFNDIKPALGKVGEHAQEMSTAYKEIKKAAHIQPQAAKLAFRLVEMEESKRDDFLRSLNGLLNTFRIFVPRDLVDQAEGKGSENSNVVPIGESPRPQLATIPADSSDLAGDDDATWRAGLKEGDTVIVPVGDGDDAGVVSATIMFIDGDKLDVEYEDAGETVKASIPRGAVSQPGADDDARENEAAADGEHLEAAE